jgi:hypothetical protein
MIHSEQFGRVFFACAISVALVMSSRVPALAQPMHAPAQSIGPIEVRPIQDTLGEAKTVRTALKLVLNGQLNRTKNLIRGSLTTNLAQDAVKGHSSFTLSGDLLSILAGLGAGASSGYKFREMGFYTLAGKSYVYMDIGEKLCYGSTLEEGSMNLMAETFNPANLLSSMGIGNDTQFAGELVGEEMINGVQTQHYKLDGPTMELMNAKSKRIRLSRGKITKGNLWVAVDGKYAVRLLQEGNGTINKFLQQQDFTGRFAVQYDTLSVNKKADVRLPASCNKPLGSPGAINPFDLSP